MSRNESERLTMIKVTTKNTSDKKNIYSKPPTRLVPSDSLSCPAYMHSWSWTGAELPNPVTHAEGRSRLVSSPQHPDIIIAWCQISWFQPSLKSRHPLKYVKRPLWLSSIFPPWSSIAHIYEESRSRFSVLWADKIDNYYYNYYAYAVPTYL